MRKAAWVVLGGLACGVLPRAADATVFSFAFSGGGISGSTVITYGPDSVVGDPASAFKITGITGSFSDATLGFANVAITGLATLIPGTPRPTNLLAPKSFSYLPVASGINSPEGLVPGYTADDLFYPAGSPPTATDYPFGGGYLDIYGVAFTLANGLSVDFWSNGIPPGSALSYGAAVTDGRTQLDEVFQGIAVPEPASVALLGTGLLGLLALRRQRPI